VASSHSGSTHAAVQAAAEVTAATALSGHVAAADPHTVYSLASGTRDYTGDVRVRKATLPILRLENSTSSNADGSRGSGYICKGQKADTTLHDLMLFGAQHEGAGNDQLARVLLQLNTGAGLATILTMTASDMLSLFVGEVRHTHGRFTHRYRSSQQTFSATATWKTVEWNGSRDADTGFTWGGTNNDTCTVGFAGRVRIAYSISVHISTLSLVAVANARILINGTLVPGSLRRSDCIDTAGLALIGGTTLSAEVVATVASSDTITVEVRSESGDTLQVEADGASVSVTRLQGAS
jgi:hypothetical protein